MNNAGYSYLYGPVPSRRLGRSLGIDLVPYKICSYDCVYCQLGSCGSTTTIRDEYFPVDSILSELERRLSEGDQLDYISLAGSGEPTLHSRIGDLLSGIKAMTSIPVAVLTNGSLLWMPEVQDALLTADLVLPSLDAGDAATFQLVNRPDGQIQFEQMVSGLEQFTRRFNGQVWLEVLLLEGIADNEQSVRKIAALVERIQPAKVQLNTVSRPPAEGYARGVSSIALQQISQLFPGTVEIISDTVSLSIVPTTADLSHHIEILALLRRRPCTALDLAQGLNLHMNDLLKQLHRMESEGVVREAVDRPGFYLATQP